MSRPATAVLGASLLLTALLAACGGGGEGGEQTCRNVQDCPSGTICLNGICRPAGSGGGDTTTACGGDDDCAGDQLCRDGRCVAPDAGGTGCSCAPEDPCTAITPGCVDGGCAVTGGECAESGDCEDGESCTIDSCVCGYCEAAAAPDEGCCVSNAECDDGAECTTDTCVFNRCRHTGGAGCCGADADCDDLDPCTIDTCAGELCSHEPLGGDCCSSDRECDDGEWCTKDACVNGRCVHPRTVQDLRCGCGAAAMCEDGNPCTTDRCEDRRCRYEAVPASPQGLTCCGNAADCDDGELGTSDTCLLNTCLHRLRPSCTADADCDGAYTCNESRCAEGVCVPAGTREEGCCESDLECDDEDTCTEDFCNTETNRCTNRFELQPGCCENDADCDDGADCTTEFCCHSSQCSGTTTNVKRNHCAYTIRPGEGCCTNDLTCDDHLPCTFDVCVDGTCHNLETGETCCTADGDCDDQDPCTTDSCAAGECSNLAVAGCCDSSTDCDDANACTIDTCEGTTCAHARIPECCTLDGECNDHDVCTEDRCNTDGACTHPRLSPCCEVDADCTSDDPCRRGTCNAAKDCVYAAVPECCHVTADCDDGDACTVDACSASRCFHQDSSAPECCQPVYAWTMGFPFGAVSVDNWSFNPPPAGFGWQVVSGRPAVSAPYSLYYGNTSTYTYVTGLANQGAARTPTLTLPNEDRVFLNTWVWLDLAGDPTANFEIRVVPSPFTVATPLWDESVLGGDTDGEFRFVGLDLTPWRGQTVMVEFFFGTQKTSQPGGEGVYLDDIEIGHGCVPSPVECQIDLDCADADPCTEAACVDQSCEVLTVAGPSCCEPRAFTATFDDGSLQGVSSGLVPGASTRYSWAPSERRASTPPGSLYFGDPTHPCAGGDPTEVCPSYGDDVTPERAGGTADIGPVSLVGLDNPLLSFDLWADVDPIAPVEPDRLDVVVISAAGQETVVWSSFSEGLQSTGGHFQPVVVSLESWAGQSVRLRFLFFTLDGFGFGEGVYVDDITVGEDCR